MKDVLYSERLTLRRLDSLHRDLIEQLYKDPEVVAGWGAKPYDDKKLAEHRNRLTVQWQSGHFRHYAVSLSESGKALGLVGITPTDDEEGEGDFGYVYRPESWGHGYATEAGRACITEAFSDLQTTRLTATALPASASWQVLEKLGFRRSGEVKEDGKLFAAASLNREDWPLDGSRTAT